MNAATFILIVLSQNVWDCARLNSIEELSYCQESLANAAHEIYAGEEYPAWMVRRLQFSGDDHIVWEQAAHEVLEEAYERLR